MLVDSLCSMRVFKMFRRSINYIFGGEDGMVVRRHHDQLISRTTEPLCPSPTAQRAGHSNEGSVVPEVAVPDVNSPEVTCGELEPPTTPEDPKLVPPTPVRRYPVRDRIPPQRSY